MNRQIILITGARKGIGRNLAEHYLQLDHIVIGVSRKESDLRHKNYSHFCADVADEKAVEALFKQIRTSYEDLNILINNAGIASMNHSLLTPGSIVRKIIETNVIGTFIFCREAAKLMAKSKQGRIVNFSTVAVPLKLEGEAIYAASKAAVVTLTSVLARELGTYGITVNAVGPTPIDTDLIKNVPNEKIQSLIERQAIKRMGLFRDVVNAVDFFVSPASDFVTGQTLYLGGV